jgi:hypothetical protein
MIFLALALLATQTECVAVRQQCRACPTGKSPQGCSSVGIACQPTRRLCEPRKLRKIAVQADRRPIAPRSTKTD